MRAVNLVNYAESVARSDYRPTAAGGSLTVINVPDNIPDVSVAAAANETVIVHLSGRPATVEFERLGYGRLVKLDT